MWGGGERGVKEWSRFKEEILDDAEDVCGSKRIREGKRGVSEWGNEEIKMVVERKEECFLVWRRTGG